MTPPGTWLAFRRATSSLIEDLGAFAAGNVIFGACLLVSVLAAQSFLLGWLLFVPLALPAAGVMRMATVHVRQGTARLADFREPIRWRPWTVLALAAVQLGSGALLLVDIGLGYGMGSLVGGLLAVFAFWLGLAWWTLAMIAWVLVLDPERDTEPIASRLRLAGLVALAMPIRFAMLAVLLAVLLAIAVLSVAIILGFGWALACLLAAHAVLPAADRLEGRRPDTGDEA